MRNELRARGEDVTFGLSRYAVERFLYRLGRSPHRERFVLKGATLFSIWGTDVGFGNAIVPGPEEKEYRTILGDPPPRILAYPPESVVAEKLHAMVTLGERNSRYKDFYDLYPMAGAFRFERSTLVRAVRATFDRRATPVEAALPAALAAPFYSDPSHASQWRAYVGRNALADAPADFARVGDRLGAFLQPVWADLRSDGELAGEWPSGGPWR